MEGGSPYKQYLPETWSFGLCWGPIARAWKPGADGPPKRREVDGAPVGPYQVRAGRLPQGAPETLR
eukprot:5180529-Alexandrium_andersonii.AAC.1